MTEDVDFNLILSKPYQRLPDSAYVGISITSYYSDTTYIYRGVNLPQFATMYIYNPRCI